MFESQSFSKMDLPDFNTDSPNVGPKLKLQRMNTFDPLGLSTGGVDEVKTDSPSATAKISPDGSPKL